MTGVTDEGQESGQGEKEGDGRRGRGSGEWHGYDQWGRGRVADE